MLDNRLLYELIIEQQLLKDTNVLLKKKQLLNKLLFISLNEIDDHLNSIFLNIIERQHRLFKYLHAQKDRHIQRQTVGNRLNQILSSESLLNDIKLNTRKKRQKNSFIPRNRLEQMKILINDISKHTINAYNEDSSKTKYNASDDEVLKIYWRSISSNNLFKKSRSIITTKSPSDTYLYNNIKKLSLFNHSSTHIHWNFLKLEKINRIHPEVTIR